MPIEQVVWYSQAKLPQTGAKYHKTRKPYHLKPFCQYPQTNEMTALNAVLGSLEEGQGKYISLRR